MIHSDSVNWMLVSDFQHVCGPSGAFARPRCKARSRKCGLASATTRTDRDGTGDRNSDSAAEQSPPCFARRDAGAAALATLTAGLFSSAGIAHAATEVATPSSDLAPGVAVARNAGALREVRLVARVTALRGSVPQQWPADFQTAMDGYGLVAMTQKPHLRDIYADLRGSSSGGSKSGVRPTTVDAVTVGDAWLQRVIAEGLVQPVANAQQQRWWSLLHPRWRQLVCRTGLQARTDPESSSNSRDSSGSSSKTSSSSTVGVPDPRGEVWGAPYRWGCTLIAYQRSKLLRRGGQPILDWGDLLQPELKGQVAFHDSPREVVGVALKTLGLPGFNATAAAASSCGIGEDDLSRRFRKLLQQARVFSNTDHTRALLAGDALAIVGSSDDLLPLAERMQGLELVAPLSGTALWADLWCIPTHAAGGAEDGEPSPLLPAWFELGLQPVRAEPSQGLKGGASPLLLPPPLRRPAGVRRVCSLLDATPEGSSQLVNWMPSEEVLQRSEFLLPLPDTATRQMYSRLLQSPS